MSKIISQSFLWKKDIHLLIVFKVKEFIIVLNSTANGFQMRIISALNGASNVSISKFQVPYGITDFMPGICMLLGFMMMTGLLEIL